LIIAAVALTTALTAALALQSVYRISIKPRSEVRPSVARTPVTADTSPTSTPLPLRLVDSGGVGIPLSERWGVDYSHDARIFHDVLLDKAPYVDAAAFQRVEQDWHAYVDRMLAYGNNAMAVPLLLELIDFDRVKTADGAAVSVYGDGDETFRARHAAVRRAFGPLFEWTARRGMQVFLTTDMLAVTPPLARHLRRLAPSSSTVGIDAADPAVWQVYRAGLDELFDAMPAIGGLIIRFGEGGSLYATAGWPYRSEVAVRDAKSLRAMLHGLLPFFEQRQKTLVLRNWTVGVGSIGRLHIDPALYERVLGDIDSPSLVVSTKYTAGDFFSYLPLNPTLLTGRHRRIVEFQARPEFEGFGAFPDFLGEEWAHALRTVRAANPHLIGTYLYSQSGGPLRAGPRMVYPFHGFWMWTDANVFVGSHLATNPSADVRGLARQWASERFGEASRDPVVGEAIANMLIETRRAVREGFYIRAFAEREVRVPGLELPPLMWIFEWDRVGGWHSLLSLVYRGTRDAVDASIAEGHDAAAIVKHQREQMRAAFAASAAAAPAPAAVARVREEALRSLEYQETLFDALAAWRQTFLSYYRWLDTSDSKAWTQWRDSRQQFADAARRHVDLFGHDLNFPAFDLRSASEAEANAGRAAWGRRLTVALLIVLVSLVLLGSPLGQRWMRPLTLPSPLEGERVPAPSPRLRGEGGGEGSFSRIARLTFTAAVTPWRLVREPVDLESSAAVSLLAIALVAMLAATLTGFTTTAIVIDSPLLVAVVALAFESTAIGHAKRAGHGRLLVASVGPLMPGIILLFVLIAWASPIGFWYHFWISPVFRTVVVTTGVAMALWTGYMMLASHAVDGWRGRVGGCLAAAGAGCLTLSALLPGWLDVLRSLDRPLNLAPATETMLFALRTYVGVSLGMGNTPYIIGGLMLAAGYALCLRSMISFRSSLR
jgi:hypothetical protein